MIIATKQLTEAEGRDFSALTISYKAPLMTPALHRPTVPAGPSPVSRKTLPATFERSQRSACTS